MPMAPVGFSRAAISVLITCAALMAACTPKPDAATLAERTLKAQTLLDTYYGSSSQLDEAGRLIDEVLRDAPDYPPAHAQAARVVIMNGHLVRFEFAGNTLERAEKILLRATELDPTYAEAHSLLGHVYTLAGKYREAEAALTEASRLGSTNPWTLVNWAHLFEMQGKYDMAMMNWASVVNEGRKTTPQELRAHIAAIEFQRNLLARSGPQYAEQVRALCKSALASAPKQDAWSWGNCANDLSIVGDFDESIVAARGALERMDYGAGRYTLACGLVGKWSELSAAGNRAEAEKYFVEASTVYPNLARLTDSFCGGGPRHKAAQQRLRERLESP
jgi:tetratricopeptide (TPR) repeat protein